MSEDVNFRLDGKVALITGGSRGLGREMALGFARLGADVVITSRKLAQCEAVAKAVEAETGRRALAHASHVGNWGDLDTLVAAAYDRFGRVDVLVNNAGMSPLYDDIRDVNEDLYDKVLAVNLKGPFRLMALVGSKMAEDGGGSIINISSIAAVHPRPGALPYAAAKAGLNTLTVGFAHSLGPGVRVNCIMAGPFATDVTTAWDPDTTAARAQNYALRRVGRPNEIVGAAVYLASDASSFTTGAVITVDGGVPH